MKLTALRDAAGVTGCSLVSYGAWLMYHPAGFLVAGAILVAGSILSARAG